MAQKAEKAAKLKGLAALVRDAVDGSSKLVERVQKESAQRPFGVLGRLPPLAAPVRGIHRIHDGVVSGVHGALRWVNRTVGRGVELALEVAHEDEAAPGRRPESGAPRRSSDLPDTEAVAPDKRHGREGAE